MGYAELIKAVEEEGRRERERILREAKKRAEQILEKARKEALKTRDTLIEKARRELKERENEAVNRARAEARKILLSAKLEILDEVFREAIERIRALPEDQYRAVIRGLFGELERDWQASGMKEEPVVYVSAEDTRFLRDVKYRVVPAEGLVAGVVFESRDKRYRAENSLSGRLERLRPELLVSLKHILFKENLQQDH